MIVFAIITNDWHMESIDFVLAYPQAPVKTNIFRQPPRVLPGLIIPDLPLPMDEFNKLLYQLLKNLYGLKDAGRTWSEHLQKGLVMQMDPFQS